MKRHSTRKSYVLRVQSVGMDWQLDLMDVQSGHRERFESLGMLMVFLERLPKENATSPAPRARLEP